MRMNIANWRMEQMIDALGKYTNETGKIGYAVARNLQALKNAAMPYFEAKQKLFAQYGHPEKVKEEGSEGKTRERYIVDDPKKVPEFAAKIAEIDEIKCEVNIYQLDVDTFVGWGLNAADMEALVWMAEGE